MSRQSITTWLGKALGRASGHPLLHAGEEPVPNTAPYCGCTSADWSILVKQIERAISGTCCWLLNQKECATSTAITRCHTTNQPGWLEERIKLIPSRVALIHRLRFKAGIPEPTRPSPSLKSHQPESDSSHKYLKFFIKIIFISMKNKCFSSIWHRRPRCSTLSSHFSSHSFYTSKTLILTKIHTYTKQFGPLLSSILCADLKKKLALFLKRYKSKSKIQTAWHQPFFEQFGGVFPTAKENELQNYGHPFTEFNPDCRCIIIISVYQRSPINDLINTMIILQSIGDISAGFGWWGQK